MPRRRSSSRNDAVGGWPSTTWRPLAGNSSTAPFSRDDDVEARQIAGDAPEIVEPAAGHEDDDDARMAGVADRVADGRIEPRRRRRSCRRSRVQSPTASSNGPQRHAAGTTEGARRERSFSPANTRATRSASSSAIAASSG